MGLWKCFVTVTVKISSLSRQAYTFDVINKLSETNPGHYGKEGQLFSFQGFCGSNYLLILLN